jgi:hypothetical protein
MLLLMMLMQLCYKGCNMQHDYCWEDGQAPGVTCSTLEVVATSAPYS